MKRRRKVGLVHVTHRMKDVSPYLAISPTDSGNKISDLLPLRVPGRRTAGRNDRQADSLGEPLHFGGRDERQRSDHRHFTSEKRLPRQHGGNLGTVADIDEERFNKIILVVAEGDLGAVQLLGLLKECGATEPGAKEAWIFPVLRAMSLAAMIGPQNGIVKTLLLKEFLESNSGLLVKARVDVHGLQMVADRDALQPLTHEPQQQHAVLPARYGYCNPVAIPDEVVVVHCLAHKAADFLVDIGHEVKQILSNGDASECRNGVEPFTPVHA